MIDLTEDVTGIPNFLNRNHGNCTMKPGPREIALRASREVAATSAKAVPAKAVSDSKRVDNPPALPANQENVMISINANVATPKSTPAKAPAKAPPKAKKPAPAPAAKAKAPKPAAKANAPAASSGRPDGLREGSKQAQMLDLALQPEGATEHTICKALGWKKCRVTLKRVCEKVGATLKTSKNAKDETVFFATLKAKA